MICPYFLAGMLANPERIAHCFTSLDVTGVCAEGHCLKEHCQLWDAARADCGLKAIAPDPELMGIVKKNAEWSRKLMELGDEGEPV